MKIELKGIKKTYVSAGAENLSVDVLKGIDVVIGQGEYVSFIGKSGCGKTTLLKIVGLLMSPTEGELFIDGRFPGFGQTSWQIYAEGEWDLYFRNTNFSVK